jgi:peptidoglycan hydrolase-like protein with peptidoglycan-binding domain
MADPGTDDIVIKKKENSDNVILLQLRLRDLGYYNYKITGYFGDFTEQSLKDFQKTNNLTTDGVASKKTLDLMYSNAAKRNPVEPRVKPKPVKAKSVKYGNYRDWFDYVNPRWPKYSPEKIKVVDFNTGKVYYVRRVGGHYHADVEPYSKKDCDILKSTYGGEWSWERRAVIVYIKGEAIAGSINGMPHGYETVKNNGMTGQVCIHFLNSRTHVHNMRDPDHQYQVKRAAGKIK